MHVVTNAELNLWCLQSLENFHIFDLTLYDFALNLYNTGVRVMELKEFERWSKINESTYKLDTEKGSDDRIFDVSKLTETLINAINSGIPCYNHFSYSQFIFYWNRFFPESLIRIGNWQLASHTYRYNKARLLHDSGWTDEQIRIYFGEIEIKNVLTYIYGVIYLP